MTTPNENQPAYPTKSWDDALEAYVDYPGLTKLERVAMAVLQGFCSNPKYSGDYAGCAHDSIQQARALLAACAEEESKIKEAK